MPLAAASYIDFRISRPFVNRASTFALDPRTCSHSQGGNMADCELLTGCLFFNDQMVKVPAIADMMKDAYCRGDNSKCARYMVFQKFGRAAVPPDLPPNDVGRAVNIISGE
jgi:hypothetical protein